MACPECGADEATGWSEKAQGQRLGLPDDDFDYDEFVRNEFGGEDRRPKRGLAWGWIVVAAILVLILLSWFLKFW